TSSHGASRFGMNRQSTPATAGNQRMTDRWTCISGRLEEEVEAEGGHAREEQQRVRAQVAGLDAARDGGAGPHEAGGATHERALHERALDHVAAEVAERGGGPHEQRVVELVEVPAVLEEVVQAREAVAQG